MGCEGVMVLLSEPRNKLSSMRTTIENYKPKPVVRKLLIESCA